LGRIFATLEAFDPAFDGFDCPTNPFLDEVRGEVGLVAQLVVQAAFGFGFGGDVVAVVAVPAPLRGGVGAVFELLDSLSNRSVCSVGSVEFDDGSIPLFSHITL
jgi:hypothetical protein